MHATLLGIAMLAAAATGATAGDASARPAPAETTVEGPTARDGILTYTVTSRYLKGPNPVEVLLPDRIEAGKRYPVLYILPVEPGTGGRWGSGIGEARRTNVHNTFGLVCVAPAFDTTPWYADHPTDPAVRHESYLLKVVLPLVEARHPALARPEGRLLVGFSKSGWGAFSLLLRHADVFGRAAAWDAPMMEQAPTKFGMAEVFGTQENFERYRITALVERQAGLLKDGAARLVLLGYGNFRTPTEGLHRRMLALGIPHVYDNATERRHHWESGWFAGAVRRLMELAPAPDGKTGAP
ncbi:MAG: hypothetical protein AMK72_07900 [Planctomycetes bacterium SM23_25]|nr:MAG: hypothetical protein AMK72_07900 [Planctomycetes bacterium SM23_25]